MFLKIKYILYLKTYEKMSYIYYIIYLAIFAKIL